MKSIVLDIIKWQQLLRQLHNDYPKSVLAISEKSKRVLGFTSREHREWVPNENYRLEMILFEKNKDDPFTPCEPFKGHYELMIHLDFYSEEKRTFFLIKYGEFL